MEVPAVRRAGGGSAPGRGGGPLEPDWITKRFGQAARELGLPPVRFHGLRHTHATLLRKANVHPKVVPERMGHAQVGVALDVYSHVGMQEEAALAIDHILRAASSPAV
ncbi:MAG: tyrosine-type recombinase/integrase [Thermodesulfobacteriota bacterium]